jgi:hypothetical protein
MFQEEQQMARIRTAPGTCSTPPGVRRSALATMTDDAAAIRAAGVEPGYASSPEEALAAELVHPTTSLGSPSFVATIRQVRPIVGRSRHALSDGEAH